MGPNWGSLPPKGGSKPPQKPDFGAPGPEKADFCRYPIAKTAFWPPINRVYSCKMAISAPRPFLGLFWPLFGSNRGSLLTQREPAQNLGANLAFWGPPEAPPRTPQGVEARQSYPFWALFGQVQLDQKDTQRDPAQNPGAKLAFSPPGPEFPAYPGNLPPQGPKKPLF